MPRARRGAAEQRELNTLTGKSDIACQNRGTELTLAVSSVSPGSRKTGTLGVFVLVELVELTSRRMAQRGAPFGEQKHTFLTICSAF